MIEIFLIFLKLGMTSFGGPIAHLGYFRDEFVQRRKWLTDHAYADLVALCQFLPGPASSQVGIALGLFRGGLPGALASWLGFTLPSAVALVLFGLVLASLGGDMHGGWLHGLKVVAVVAAVFAGSIPGALVFGGGHVVLPLLQAKVVPAGWVSGDTFLAGYSAAQAMQRAMLGVNAAVVGLLLAAFYQPAWTSAILSQADFALAALAFLLLVFWKAPPWLVVALCALAAGLGWR